MKLNEQQKRAANFLNGICAVISVPGAGKTTVMSARIGNLVKKHGVAPENILGLTFTRNAADAMRQKLSPVLDELSSRVMLATIHSFCFWLLKSEGVVFEIVSGKEQLVMIRKTMKDAGIKDLSTGMVLSEISLAKNNLISVEEFRDLYEGDKTMQKIAAAYEAYDAEKKKKMLLDFDDLLVQTHNLLSENTEVREKYQSSFRHLLIDEFQDTNPVSLSIMKLLIDNSNGASFWVCGDDAQSIYAFTGASVANILNFKKLFPASHEIILNLNYRSTQKIISACQNLISHNVRRIEKTFETHNQQGEDVVVFECISEEDEAKQVAEEITDLTSKGYEHKDIAILYRANFQSRVVEECFLQLKIPYRIENGMSFYQRREVKILLDYLRVIQASESDEGDESLKGVINVPNRYIGRKFTGELERFAAKNGIHLYPALKSMPIELPYVRKNVKEFVNFLDPLIAQPLEPGELIALLRNSLDYDRLICEDEIPSIDDQKISNLNQLQLAATKYDSIESFLSYTDGFQGDTANDKDGVSLMTIHKCKGLQFPVVFVIGLVEGILPSKRGDLEEERRICFVGISRAMKKLYLTHSFTYLGQSSKKSIFLDEILGNKK
ncbi:MAG: ATP-dependent helicase [Syntrophobacteraceae bacterium]